MNPSEPNSGSPSTTNSEPCTQPEEISAQRSLPPNSATQDCSGATTSKPQVGGSERPVAVPGTAQADVPAATGNAAKNAKVRQRGGFLGSVQSLAITVVIAVFVITFIVQAFQIPSESMEDTLLIGDYLLVDKVHFGRGGIWGGVLPYTGIHRGDIIVFRYPVHPQQHFVKRVIGLPGDHVRMKDKQLFVNGQRVRESYVVFRSRESDPYRDDFPRLDFLNANVEASWWLRMRALVQNGELVVPPRQYFVLGDNRDESLDSRYWGLVPRENIIGRPLVIYWSMNHPERLGRVADGAGDKLLYFAYAITHLFQETRWNRTFRLIR